MKKIIIVLFVFVSMSIQAQEMSPGTGWLGVGIGPSVSYISYNTSASPALRLNYDKGFREIGPGTLSLGGSIGWFSRKYDGQTYSLSAGKYYPYSYSWNHIVTAFRVGYFYNMKEVDVDALNLYGGLSTGLRFDLTNTSYSGPADGEPIHINNNPVNFHMGLFIGANYFLTSKIAGFMEFGYDISWVTLGATFHL